VHVGLVENEWRAVIILRLVPFTLILRRRSRLRYVLGWLRRRSSGFLGITSLVFIIGSLLGLFELFSDVAETVVLVWHC
jgi:hypothetical protein